jgi:hypothetical protein
VNQIACAALVLAPALAQAQTWRTLDVSRQLRDSSQHHITVRYPVGRFTLAATDDPVLFSMQLRYDETRTRPLHDFDAAGRSALLGLENENARWTGYLNERNRGEMKLALSNAIPLQVNLELGATEARVDAGGLMLDDLRVHTGAAEAYLDFSLPNRRRMRHLDLDLGAAGFVVTNLGNANVSSITVNGGVGSVDLDFSGDMQDNTDVAANVALGKLTLHVPADVGLRIEVKRLLASFDHPGLHKRGNAYYSDNFDTARFQVRVRAETVFGAIEVDRGR